MRADERGHSRVFARARSPAEHDSHDVPIIGFDVGYQVEARRAGIPRLDAVDAFDAPKQLVVIAVALAGVVENSRLEIRIIAREAVLDRAGENREIARRGDLLWIRQARRIAVDGAAHSERARFLRHMLRESLFGTCKIFSDGSSDIVGGFGHQRFDGVLDRNSVAGVKAKLRGRLLGSMSGNAQGSIERQATALELLEQDIERHHLGDGSGMAKLVLILRMERASGLRVDNHGGEWRVVAPAAMMPSTRLSRRRQAD